MLRLDQNTAHSHFLMVWHRAKVADVFKADWYFHFDGTAEKCSRDHPLFQHVVGAWHSNAANHVVAMDAATLCKPQPEGHANLQLVDGRTDARTDRRTDGQTDGRTDDWSRRVDVEVARQQG